MLNAFNAAGTLPTNADIWIYLGATRASDADPWKSFDGTNISFFNWWPSKFLKLEYLLHYCIAKPEILRI